MRALEVIAVILVVTAFLGVLFVHYYVRPRQRRYEMETRMREDDLLDEHLNRR